MTPLERQADNAVRFIKRWHRYPWGARGSWSQDDARQEAVAVMLGCDDPTGPAAFKAAVRQVGRAIRRWQNAASIGDRGAEQRVQVHALSTASFEQAARGEEVEQPAALVAQSDQEHVATLVRWEMLRAALRAAELNAVRGLPKYVRQMGQVLQERGRYYGMHADLAERHGISRYAVIRALGRWRKTADQSRDVQQLQARLAQFEEEIRT